MNKVINESNQFWKLLEKGNCYADKNEYFKALESYQKAEIFAYTKEEKLALLYCQSYVYMESKKYQKALAFASQLLEIDPSYKDANSLIASVYFYRKDFKNALVHYKKELSIQPSKYEIYFDIGLVYFSQKNYSSAINYFSQAIKLEPNNPEFYEGRANTLFKMGKARNDEAMADYERAASLGSKNGGIFHDLATYYADEKKDYFLALVYFKKTLKLGGDEDTYFNTQLTYQNLGKDKEAIKTLKDGMHKFPKSLDLKHELACIYHELGKTKEAKRIENEIDAIDSSYYED